LDLIQIKKYAVYLAGDSKIIATVLDIEVKIVTFAEDFVIDFRSKNSITLGFETDFISFDGVCMRSIPHGTGHLSVRQSGQCCAFGYHRIRFAFGC
jgi:hypothetical protein